jgi:hypothetical protein
MSVMSRFAEMVEEDTDNKNVIICPIHGEYPASLKAFGCPTCDEERREQEEEEEMLMNSRTQRFNGGRR